MSFMTSTREDLKGVLEYGQQVRFRYYTGSISTDEYDDAQTLTKSGNDTWTSGLALPITNKFGSSEAFLIEQGKIKFEDKKLYVAGDIETSALMKIRIGSEEHSIIPDGVTNWPSEGDIVYKKLYCRTLPNGSLIGEM